MSVLYQRAWTVRVDNMDLSGLHGDFSVFKSDKREPNTAEIKIFGLASDTRSRLEGSRDLPITLGAGYQGDTDPPILFVGDSRSARSSRDGAEIITTIQARDFGRLYQQARLIRSYGPATPVVNVLRDLVRAMGVGEGNLAEFAAAFQLRNGMTNFPDGYAIQGPVRRSMDALLRGAGLRWSIQNNALQIQRQGQPLQTRAVYLSASSGLIGSPEKDSKGVVTAVSLIQGGLDPGRKLSLDSERVSGDYKIRTVEYQGALPGAEWYATLTLKPIT